jgi:alpha-tubulin suppressor-like RCC1 family protein
VAVAAGCDIEVGHSLAVKSDGSLWTWGSNFYGEIGEAPAPPYNRTAPARVGTADDWADVSAGIEFSLAVKKDGSLWAWGQNDAGQLGRDIMFERDMAKVDEASDWALASAGHEFSMGLKKDGNLWSWGRGLVWQLGRYIGNNGPNPDLGLVASANVWLSVSAGGALTLAMTADGELWAWGSNTSGELGRGTMSSNYGEEPGKVEGDGWLVPTKPAAKP